MKLYELQSSSLENELENTASQIGRANPQKDLNNMDQGGAAGADPMGGQPGMDPSMDPRMDPTGQQQNQPDSPLLSDPDAPIEIAKAKKIDSYITSTLRKSPYVTQYRWDPNSKIAPGTIAGMDLDQLYQLRNLVRNKINLARFRNNFGTYTAPSSKFYQDMMSFVEKAIDLKKQSTKGTSPQPKTQEARKNQPGPARPRR